MSDWGILFTNQAEDDLRGIYEYIALTLLEPVTAKDLTQRIVKQIFKLKVSPQRHAVYPKNPWKSRGLRRVNVGNYAIFFVIIENTQTVVVIRIMYGGRNIERILDDTPDI